MYAGRINHIRTKPVCFITLMLSLVAYVVVQGNRLLCPQRERKKKKLHSKTINLISPIKSSDFMYSVGTPLLDIEEKTQVRKNSNLLFLKVTISWFFDTVECVQR